MTPPQPLPLANWLLHRFASGPRRDSLIGDIVAQYQLGRSPTWYRRQVLAAMVIGATTYARTHARPVLGAAAVATTLPVLLVTAGPTLLFNTFVFVYCSAGVGAVLLTIIWPDRPGSFTLLESTRP